MKPSIRLSPRQAEATCMLCGKCERVTAGTAILAALEATRRIVEHRRLKHYKPIPQTRDIARGASSHSVQRERSGSGRGNGRAPASIAYAGV